MCCTFVYAIMFCFNESNSARYGRELSSVDGRDGRNHWNPQLLHSQWHKWSSVALEFIVQTGLLGDQRLGFRDWHWQRERV